jgi:hypothetical protein
MLERWSVATEFGGDTWAALISTSASLLPQLGKPFHVHDDSSIMLIEPRQ